MGGNQQFLPYPGSGARVGKKELSLPPDSALPPREGEVGIRGCPQQVCSQQATKPPKIMGDRPPHHTLLQKAQEGQVPGRSSLTVGLKTRGEAGCGVQLWCLHNTYELSPCVGHPCVQDSPLPRWAARPHHHLLSAPSPKVLQVASQSPLLPPDAPAGGNPAPREGAPVPMAPTRGAPESPSCGQWIKSHRSAESRAREGDGLVLCRRSSRFPRLFYPDATLEPLSLGSRSTHWLPTAGHGVLCTGARGEGHENMVREWGGHGSGGCSHSRCWLVLEPVDTRRWDADPWLAKACGKWGFTGASTQPGHHTWVFGQTPE